MQATILKYLLFWPFWLNRPLTRHQYTTDVYYCIRLAIMALMARISTMAVMALIIRPN